MKSLEIPGGEAQVSVRLWEIQEKQEEQQSWDKYWI